MFSRRLQTKPVAPGNLLFALPTSFMAAFCSAWDVEVMDAFHGRELLIGDGCSNKTLSVLHFN